jgi:hypothetical protein
MEGVIVSAKKGIVTVSVVTNDKGEFSFPRAKLGAGDYALRSRWAGLKSNWWWATFVAKAWIAVK